jgi:hypothetical protein
MIKLKAIFDGDSKRYHRFLIEPNDYAITGSLYVRKGQEKDNELNILLMTKAEAQKIKALNNG